MRLPRPTNYRARYYDSNIGRFVSEDPMRVSPESDFYTYVENDPLDYFDPLGLKPLTPEQCRELKEVLYLEQNYGSFVAAAMGNITFNPNGGLLWAFNSSNSDYEPVQSALGPINLDWFSTLEASSSIGVAYIRYGAGKLLWIGLRHVRPIAPVRNNLPYSDPGERNAAWQVTLWRSYKDLFPPDWMQKNCPCDGGAK